MKPFVLLSLALIALTSACVATVGSSTPAATASSLMQTDRDFAVETHARGIDGWMSFYAADAIRVRYRGNMIKGLAAVRDFDLPAISDTTSTLNWEPSDAYVFHGGAIGSTTAGTGLLAAKWVRQGKSWATVDMSRSGAATVSSGSSSWILDIPNQQLLCAET